MQHHWSTTLKKLATLAVITTVWAGVAAQAQHDQRIVPGKRAPLPVRRCDDFKLQGGIDEAWQRTNWVSLVQLDSSRNRYATEFKILYSSTGIYVLFRGVDNKITTDEYDNFDNIFKGDVFEVFFHPHPQTPVYLEYEVNAMNKEFLLMLSRVDGKLTGWIPRFGDVKHAAGIKKYVGVDGEQKINGPIRGWRAEIYFPFSALGLLPGVPPKPGDIWHANFCRLDYDDGTMVKWSWSAAIQKSFHELEAYQSIRFD